MNRFLIYILMVLMVSSCYNGDRPKKPDNLISKNKMVDIITDISLISAAKSVDKKLLENKGINPENFIYKKYGIDSVLFEKSNNFYAYDIKDYEEIYFEVNERLEKHRAEIVAIEEKERKEKDSIRKSIKKSKDSIKRSKLLKETKPSNLLKKNRTSPK